MKNRRFVAVGMFVGVGKFYSFAGEQGREQCCRTDMKVKNKQR